MTHEIEELLRKAAPTPPEDNLRERVLAAVSEELARSGDGKVEVATKHEGSGWLRFSSMAVAAGLVLAIGMNAWVFDRDAARQARFFPRATPRAVTEVVNAIESVTDRETAVAIGEGLERAYRKPETSREQWNELQQLTLELTQSLDG